MPLPGCAWWHLIFSTKSSWLPGDPRGFRDHGHRLHSSGDYKHPPPPDEHEALLRHNQRRAGPTVIVDAPLQPRIGEALLQKTDAIGARVLCVTVSRTHAHLLIELPADADGVNREAGRLKQFASHRVRDAVPGALWAKSGEPIRIRDRRHQHRVYRYILDHARKENAWVWKHDDANSTQSTG